MFKAALKTGDVTFQNLDSSEISITGVSHYYDSGPTKAVAGLRDDKKKPMSFMADTTLPTLRFVPLPRMCILMPVPSC